MKNGVCYVMQLSLKLYINVIISIMYGHGGIDAMHVGYFSVNHSQKVLPGFRKCVILQGIPSYSKMGK